MPQYSHKCPDCHNEQEAFYGIRESPEVLCNKCGARTVRQIAYTNTFILKNGRTGGFHSPGISLNKKGG